METKAIHRNIGIWRATTKLTVSNGNYTLPTPTKADHIFTGWYNKDSVQFIPGTTLTQDTIHAHWNQLRFTITFIDGDSVRKVTVNNGHYVPPNPSKFDYQFEGWANEDGETFDAASILTSDTILYAQWKQYVYTITLGGRRTLPKWRPAMVISPCQNHLYRNVSSVAG